MSIRTTRQRKRKTGSLIKNLSTEESCNTYAALGGFDFDYTAEDRIIIHHGSDMNYTAALTVAYWIKGPYDSSGGSSVTHFSKEGDGSGDKSWLCRQAFNALQVELWPDSSQFTRKMYTASHSLVAGQWSHYCFTFADDTLTIYINGSEVTPTKNSDATATQVYASATNIVIAGNEENPPDQYSTYPIDDALIYDAELTASQVSDLYNSGVKPNVAMLDSAPNLKHWYKLGNVNALPDVRDYAGDYTGTAYGDLANES